MRNTTTLSPGTQIIFSEFQGQLRNILILIPPLRPRSPLPAALVTASTSSARADDRTSRRPRQPGPWPPHPRGWTRHKNGCARRYDARRVTHGRRFTISRARGRKSRGFRRDGPPPPRHREAGWRAVQRLDSFWPMETTWRNDQASIFSDTNSKVAKRPRPLAL
jgi:hypothetical protein